jgi:hypothetical protein
MLASQLSILNSSERRSQSQVNYSVNCSFLQLSVHECYQNFFQN